MARYDDLNTTAIAYATFVSSVLLLVIILLVRALCYSWVEGEDVRQLQNSHYVEADMAIAQQKERIAVYTTEQVEVVPEPEAGGESEATAVAEPVLEERIHIPIEQAKKLLLEELAAAGHSGNDA